MKIISAFAMCLICIQLYAYNRSIEYDSKGNSNEIINTDSMKLKITVGTNIFLATLYNNATANAFKAMLPMTVSMAELNGNEKYFNLSNNLPANASNPGTVHTGDLMLYGSNTLVLFYKSFSTTYTYTKLGHMDSTSGLVSVLGSDSITIEFELEN
jgi:hypothetical protein